MGKVLFHRCVSVHRGGGVVSHGLWSQVLSLVSSPRFFPRGWGYPSPITGPAQSPVQGPAQSTGVPPKTEQPRTVVPPSQDRTGGTPMTGWGLFLTPGQDWGCTPNLPPHRTRMVVRRGRYASCIHAGGLSSFLWDHNMSKTWSYRNDNQTGIRRCPTQHAQRTFAEGVTIQLSGGIPIRKNLGRKNNFQVAFLMTTKNLNTIPILFLLEMRMNLEIYVWHIHFAITQSQKLCTHSAPPADVRNPWETVVRSRCDMLHVKLLPGQRNLFSVVVRRKLFVISWLLLYLCVVVVDVFDLFWNTCNGCVDVEQMSRHVSLITRNRSVDLNKLELTTDLDSAYRPGCSCYMYISAWKCPQQYSCVAAQTTPSGTSFLGKGFCFVP